MSNLKVKFDYPMGVRKKVKEWVLDNPCFESIIYSMVIESKIDTMFACPEIEGLADKFKTNFKELEMHLDGKDYSHVSPTETGLEIVASKKKNGIGYSHLRSVNDIRFFKNQDEMSKWFKGPGKHCSRYILICTNPILKEYGLVNSNQGTLEECLKINGKMFDYITAKKAQWALLGFNINGNEGAINSSTEILKEIIIRTTGAKKKVRGKEVGKLFVPIN
ncbi:hypothetical protein TOTORO_03120 [Serratia phage vB_SmaS-Totoro]|nr:hypothetical protein TOTORO_03120 [Serratia phage vB_SmaS-Totoro]